MVQGLIIIASIENTTNLGLINTYFNMKGMIGAHLEEYFMKIDQSEAKFCVSIVLTHANAPGCVQGIIPRVFKKISKLSEDEFKRYFITIAFLFVKKSH